MSITTGRSPIVMNAVGDDLASVWQPRDMNSTQVPLIKLKITDIKYVAAASGQCVLKNRAGGAVIWISKDIAPGEVDETAFGDSFWQDGVYVDQNPVDGGGQGGKVFLFYD